MFFLNLFLTAYNMVVSTSIYLCASLSVTFTIKKTRLDNYYMESKLTAIKWGSKGRVPKLGYTAIGWESGGKASLFGRFLVHMVKSVDSPEWME